MAGQDDIWEEVAPPAEEPGAGGPVDGGKAPSALTWPIRRAWWAIEDRILWPIADVFRRGPRRRGSKAPLAWVGATALVMVAAGASAAAVFFYNEAEDNGNATVVTPEPAQTVIVPMEPTDPAEPTLQGVVPSFEQASGKDGKNSGDVPADAVEPAPEPSEPSLSTAYDFANAFAAWEVGRERAAKAIRRNATPGLARQLLARPPRQPEGTRVPQARVLNVVGRKGSSRNRKEASVSLLRAGAASELRLDLVRKGKGKWLVSKVKG